MGGGEEGGGEDGGGDEDGGADGEDGVPPVSVGVCQSRQSARLPAFRLEILNTPAALPVFSRNFWRFCCNGVRHSGRTAQCVPLPFADVLEDQVIPTVDTVVAAVRKIAAY